MRPLAKLAVFTVALVAVFGGGVAIGATVGPTGSSTPTTTHVEHTP